MVARDKQKNMIPWKKAWMIILLSVFVVNGSALMGISYFRYRKLLQTHDPAYNIVALVQTSSYRELLKQGHLPELLNLSFDRPINLFDFDIKEAEQRLNATIAIKNAVIKKIRPGTLHVDYLLREPIALVGNYTNTALDAEGVMFPLKPFFTPKRIPRIIFADSLFDVEGGEKDKDGIWGKELRESSSTIALEILKTSPKFLGDHTTILLIDVSKSEAPSFGQRQIILTIEETYEKIVNSRPIIVVAKRTLRLFPGNWHQQLVNYSNLRKHLNEMAAKKIINNEIAVVNTTPVIIDLRLTNLAFIGS